ncbi:MAG TPA: hypothetical protein VIN10_07855 [Bacteroidales bacterium]
MPKKALLLILVLFNFSFFGYSQVNANDSVVSAFMPSFAYSFQIPGGDVADQYGYNSTIGGGLMFKTNKNLLLSLNIGFIFGNQINNADSILRFVETEDGYIIDGNGTYALYSLYERGYNLSFNVGKVINVLSPNPNSGLMLSGGIGYIAHRLNIDVQHETAPQISGDYALGYDRLTSGFSLNEFVGYFFMGKSRVLNFYAGFEFYQAFTKSQRDYIFDQMGADNSRHTDFFYGFRVGWMIPIYDRAPDSYYYY